MPSNSTKTINEIHWQISNFCLHLAGPCEIVAVCQSEDYIIEEPSQKSTIEVLLVLNNFQPRLMSYIRAVQGRSVVFLVVDQWIFERDVDRGFLGEALARLLIFPYAGLSGGDYLRSQEISLKRRLILELLENIVLSYPELSPSMRIKPEYFMYEVMLNRVRVFPPMAFGAAPFLCRQANKVQVDLVLTGYLNALRDLERSGLIGFSNGEVVISDKFFSASRNPAMRVANQIKNAPRAIFTSVFGVFPQLLNFLSQNSEAFFRFQTLPWKKGFGFSSFPGNFVDPLDFIKVPTAEGSVSLADKMDIRGFAKRILKEGEFDKIKVEEFGGVLNDVYLLKARTDHTERKILVKRFKDLSSFKWFPLSMWGMGTTKFVLLGRSRLERESAINGILAQAGFNVPRLLHVSAVERLVFMEYIEGKNLSNSIKRIASASSLAEVQRELSLIALVGETYAKIHALNIVLGDTKPENVMVTPEGTLYLLDFEQASRRGDKSWDIACFLYYCGHYVPRNGEQKAEAIANSFISGYLKTGGNMEQIRCAATTKYTRVFSIFTLPSILRTMATTCKKAQQPNETVKTNQ